MQFSEFLRFFSNHILHFQSILMMASSQRFIGASIEDATGKDAAYCNAYVDNIYQYICHSNATVDINQMVTSQSIK